MVDLSGKIAIVTGAGGDIGVTTIGELIRCGASVFAADISGGALERLGEFAGPHLRTGICDVTDGTAVQAMVEQAQRAFGRVDILFNNAGVEGGRNSAWRRSHDIDVTDFDLVFAVNVKGVMNCMRHAIPIIAATGGGAVINTSSVAAVRPVTGQMPYAASKSSVIGMTSVAARRWARDGVRVNCVNPGPLEGRMMEAIAAGIVESEGGEPDGLRTTMVPMGRWGLPSEVAKIVCFLASNRARGVSGGAYLVDGGLSA